MSYLPNATPIIPALKVVGGVFFLLLSLLVVRPVACKTIRSAGSWGDELTSVSLKESQESKLPKLKTLLQTPWSKLEKRLDKMSWPEVKRAMYVLGSVAGDAKRMIDLGTDLEERKIPEFENRFFMVEMMDKYGVADTSTISYIFDKDNPTVRDFQFLLLRFKEILKLQRRSVEICLKIRRWLSSAASIFILLDSPEEYHRWLTGNIGRIKAFEKLSAALKNYEDSL